MYPVYNYESVPSTNTIAKDLAEQGACHGTSVIAQCQTSGRGRLGKEWYSVSGKGLFCSIIVRPELTLQDYPKITLAAGLAAATAIDQLTLQNSQLKWPNDIYFSGKKCGGILTESSVRCSQEGGNYAIVGIGINVNNEINDYPLELRDQVTSMFLQTNSQYSIKEVFDKIRMEVMVTLAQFSKDGFSNILREWKKKDYLYGKKMKCVAESRILVEGVALGPDGDGQLHVRDDQGKLHSVLSGDVRLATKK